MGEWASPVRIEPVTLGNRVASAKIERDKPVVEYINTMTPSKDWCLDWVSFVTKQRKDGNFMCLKERKKKKMKSNERETLSNSTCRFFFFVCF